MADGVGPVDLDALAGRVRFTCARVGVERATVGLMVIGPDEMARINGEHRDKPTPTDVLSFPVDGPEALDWPPDQLLVHQIIGVCRTLRAFRICPPRDFLCSQHKSPVEWATG